MSAKENPSDGELSEDADLQDAYNKFCKVAAKDAINVELGLKKIASLKLKKKNLIRSKLQTSSHSKCLKVSL